jgi:transcriptional regulator with XRE-family HTH domain
MYAVAFGKYLRSIREAKKMSVDELAEEAEISKSYVNMIECGHRTAPPETIRKLSPFLVVLTSA